MSTAMDASKKNGLVLSCRGVAKTFGRVQALRGVDLRVSRGGIFGLVGPNGAGKTTLFSIICGFLQPDQGMVEVAGRIVDAANRLPSGMVATLPQDAQMMPSQSIGSQLAYYGRLVGMDDGKAKAEAMRVLDLVGLTEVYGRKAKTLSHGMYKRVGIAQAFIGEQVTMTVWVYSQENLADVSRPELPQLDNFWMEKVEAPTRITPRDTKVSGRRFSRYMVERIALFPLGEGEHRFDPVRLKVTMAGGFFSRGRKLNLKSQQKA